MGQRNDSTSRADEFVALYASCELELHRFVHSLLPHANEADDVVQETAKALWQKFSAGEVVHSFRAWARAVAYRQMLKHIERERTRRKYFSQRTMEALADTRIAYQPVLEGQRRALADCVARLPGHERDLLRQRYENDTTMKTLAQQTGRTANSLYKLLQRIREKLLACVRAKLDAEGVA